jgi:cysteine desulfuration protein SufE
MSIKDIQEEIVDEFSMFDTSDEILGYIIDLGKSLPKIEEQFKTDDYVIKGCQSTIWLHADYTDGKVIFKADSNAIIPKGIIAVLLRIFSNQTPNDILQVDNSFFMEVLELQQYLNMNRNNGLAMMIKQIKLYALGYSIKN